jgi:hypothetical protein
MRTFLNLILALVIVGALLGAGAYVYNAGVAQGMATSDKIIVPDGGVAPYPYSYGPVYRPWGFGFGLFGLIFPLLFFFLIFGLIRGLFFRSWRGSGPWGQHRDWPHGVPPLAEEWHRKMHEQSTETK